MDNPFSNIGGSFIIIAIIIFCVWVLVWLLIIEYAVKSANRKTNKAIIGMYKLLTKMAEQQGVSAKQISEITREVEKL